MRRPAFRLATWALGMAGLVATAAPAARADFFEYTSTVTITNVLDPASGTTITSGTEDFTQGSFTQNATYAGVRIDNGAGTADDNEVRVLALGSNTGDGVHDDATAPDGTNVVIAAFDPVLGASSASQTISFNYSIVFNLTNYADATSGVALGTGSITITGRITGSLGQGKSNLNNFDFATSPSTGIFTTTDGTQFQVAFSGFTPPGTSNVGTLGIHIEALPGTTIPEPGSLALLALGGFGTLGLYFRRRSRPAA